jgi:hypothetical protein
MASSEIDVVMKVFIASGLAFLAIGLPAAWLFGNPQPACTATRSQPLTMKSAEVSYPPSKVVTMPQFYLLWLQLFANAIAGISIISNAVPLIA